MEKLVSYSSSSSEEEEDEAPLTKRKRHADDQCCVPEAPSDSKRRATGAGADGQSSDMTKPKSNLPLPGAVMDMFGKDKETADRDNPQEHGGRVRSFPHVEGNWASYVYIPVAADERLNALIDQLLLCLRPLNFKQMDDLHISLSRTVCIRHHWIQPLTESLKEHFQNLDSCLCDVRGLKMYTNDEKTRTFISLEVCIEESNLTEYVSAVDACFQEFNLPSFYKDPSCHISLLWAVDDVISKIPEKTKEKIQTLTEEFLSTHTDLSVIPVNQVYLKTGNKMFAFHLNNIDE